MYGVMRDFRIRNRSRPDPVAEFRAIYDKHYDDLWRYCVRRATSAQVAEDVLSETFAVAWTRFAELPDAADVRPWLFAIARNHLRNAWRSTNRDQDLRTRLVSEPEPPSADPAEVAAGGTARVLAALAQMTDDEQEILRLAAWEQLPHREVAQLVNCSENAVAIRLHRARARLAGLVQPATSTPTDTLRSFEAANPPNPLRVAGRNHLS